MLQQVYEAEPKLCSEPHHRFQENLLLGIFLLECPDYLSTFFSSAGTFPVCFLYRR